MKRSKITAALAAITGISTFAVFCLVGCVIDSLSISAVIGAMVVMIALAGITTFEVKLTQFFRQEELRAINAEIKRMLREERRLGA